MNEIILRQLSVRISTKIMELAGSGTLFSHDGKIFILTAGHVAKLIKDSGIAEIYANNQQEKIEFTVDKIKFHEYYNHTTDENDVALIDVTEYIDSKKILIHPLSICKYKYNDICVLRGYPQTNEDTALELSGIDMKVLTKSIRLEKSIFQIQPNAQAMLPHTDKDLAGLSGAGVLKEVNGKYSLVGIFVSRYLKSSYGNVNCYHADMLQDILCELKQEAMDYDNDYPPSYKCYGETLLDGMDDCGKKNIIQAAISDIINVKKLTPDTFIDKNPGIFEEMHCNCDSPENCNDRWENHLLMLMILDFLNPKRDDFMEPEEEINGQNIPIGFLCAESKNSKVNHKTIITKLYELEKEGSKIYKDGSFLMWSTDREVYSKPVGRARYKNIIKDYTAPSAFFDGTDVARGEMTGNSYDLVSLKGFLKELYRLDDNVNAEEIVSTLKEVISSARNSE